MNRRYFLQSLLASTLVSSNVLASEFTDNLRKTLNKPRELAILLDDCGEGSNDCKNIEKLLEYNVPITFMVVPKSKYEKEVCKVLGEYENCSVGMHQPGEAINFQNALQKHNAIFNDFSPEQAYQRLEENFDHLNNLLLMYNWNLDENRRARFNCFNNHMSSLVTQNKELMRVYADFIKREDLVAIDSRSSNKSCFYDTCIEHGLKAEKNARFLDKGTIGDDALSLLNNFPQKLSRQIAIAHAGNLNSIEAIIKYHKTPNTFYNLVRI